MSNECESRTMSATAIREERQTTLPADVSEAAGLKPGDQVDWRFEEGEIRGRKIAPQSEPRRIVGKLVRRGGALVCDTDGLTINPEDIARAVREERDR
jgi:bifunctional DNA-binding transcriptional regulator/antitoxin component of YhaV-PrlF toxin-antitoxin module